MSVIAIIGIGPLCYYDFDRRVTAHMCWYPAQDMHCMA